VNQGDNEKRGQRWMGGPRRSAGHHEGGCKTQFGEPHKGEEGKRQPGTHVQIIITLGASGEVEFAQRKGTAERWCVKVGVLKGTQKKNFFHGYKWPKRHTCWLVNSHEMVKGRRGVRLLLSVSLKKEGCLSSATGGAFYTLSKLFKQKLPIKNIAPETRAQIMIFYDQETPSQAKNMGRRKRAAGNLLLTAQSPTGSKVWGPENIHGRPVPEVGGNRTSGVGRIQTK